MKRKTRTKRPARKAAPPVNVLLAWRERHGFSQRDAVRTLHCSRAAWQGWETGNPVPGYIRLAMLAIDADIRLADD